MKQNIFLFLRRWQFPLLMLLSFMPLMLLLLCIDAPESLGASAVLFAAYAVSSGLCILVPGRRRMLIAALCSAAMLALTFLFMPAMEHPPLLLLPTGLGALLFFSLPLAMRRVEAEAPPYVYIAGVGVHVLVQFLHRYFQDYNGASPYEPVSGALTASLIGYIVLFLLSMNRISLDNASLVRFRLPAGMRGVNTALTLAFIALSLLLTMTPVIARGIAALWRLLCAAVAALLSLLLSLLPQPMETGIGAQGGAPNMFPTAETPSDPSAFAALMEKAAAAVTTLLLIVGAAALVRLLAQLILRLVRRLKERLRLYMADASAEYADEITDTREDGALREIRFLRRRRSRALQRDATPAGRIRFAYARLLRRRPQWSASSTARENLPEDAAALYERARYSDHPVTSGDAERFEGDVRRT